MSSGEINPIVAELSYILPEDMDLVNLSAKFDEIIDDCTVDEDELMEKLEDELREFVESQLALADPEHSLIASMAREGVDEMFKKKMEDPDYRHEFYNWVSMTQPWREVRFSCGYVDIGELPLRLEAELKARCLEFPFGHVFHRNLSADIIREIIKEMTV